MAERRRTGLDDTSSEAHAREIAHWRAATPEERIAAVGRLNGALLALARRRQDAWYPDATPWERKMRLASLWIDRDTMVRLWGWDPDVRGR